MAEPLEYTIALRTDVGQSRAHNEDAVAVVEVPGARQAFILCDGMGGLRAGDVAAREAVKVVAATLRERFAPGIPRDPLEELRLAFERANDAVNSLQGVEPPAEEDDAPTQRRMGSANPENAAMGTTCVAGIVLGDDLYLAHAGDSRAYIFRGGQLTPLTEDHSYVAQQVRAGNITEAEARVSKFRNMIVNAIGILPTVEPDLRRERLLPGDAILVCSDGLTTEVQDSQIRDILRSNPLTRASPQRVADLMIDAANRAGGRDNTSVILLSVGGKADAAMIAAATPSGSAAGRTSSNGRSGRVAYEDEQEERAPARRSTRTGRPVEGLPLLPMLGGAAVVVSLVGAILATSPGSRHQMAQLLYAVDDTAPGAQKAAKATKAPAPLVYNKLTYDSPQRFSRELVRGDLLAAVPGKGLIAVADGSGIVEAIGKDGNGTPTAHGSQLNAADMAGDPPPRNYVAADPDGDFYVTSPRTATVEKRGPDGTLLATIKGFQRPEAVAVDEAGNVYVVDANLIQIARAHPPGTQAPSPANSPGPARSAAAPVLPGAKKAPSTPKQSAKPSSSAKTRE